MTSKSSLKKTARRKLWGSKKVRMFLHYDSRESIRIIIFFGKITAEFTFHKKEIDFYFQASSLPSDYNRAADHVQKYGYKEISKDYLRGRVEPYNISNLKGAKKKKAIQLANAWYRIETFFSK